MKKEESLITRYATSGIILLSSLVGFYSSFYLTLEKINIIKDPDKVLPCDVNSLFNCGIVMRSEYSEIFGIPWSLFGVAGYTAVMLLAFALLEKKQMSRLFALITTAGALGAFVLSTYFMYLTAYVIGAFCPFCLASAFSSTIVFFTLVSHYLATNSYHFNKEKAGWFAHKIRTQWHFAIIIPWFIGLYIFVNVPFW